MIALIVLLVCALSAAIFDGWTTVRGIKSGRFVEAGIPTKWIIGKTPTALKTYLFVVGAWCVVAAASAYAFYAGSHLWMIAPIVTTVAHGYAVWHNVKLF